MPAKTLWRGTCRAGAGWVNLDRRYSAHGFFFAEDPGVAKTYAQGTGIVTAYRVLPCRTLSLVDPIHALISKNKVVTAFLDDWMSGIWPPHEDPRWVYNLLSDGTFYAYEGHRSWNSLICAVELAGFDHLVLKDLSEISRDHGPLYQEEPIVHVVFNKKYIEEVTAPEARRIFPQRILLKDKTNDD